MIVMRRFQFSLRQLVIAVGVVAVVLVAARFAMRSHGLAVGMLAMLIGAVLLVVTNFLAYGFLRAVGSVFEAEPERLEQLPKPPATPDGPPAQ